ncbi:MAG: hypothetical protein DSZ03_09235 [Sulfurimonas sp.]|nr:MAG: hypothetical protein DSZ03_09235 [Sulfurimonas sp.]
MALLPKILHVKKLQLANEIHSIIWSVLYTFGMAVSGFLVYKVGVSAAFILDGLLFVLCFVMLMNVRIEVRVNPATRNIVAMFKETLSYIRHDRKVFYLMLLHALVGLTAFDALVALMVHEYYTHLIATSLAIGLLHASRALGLVVGPLLIGRHMTNTRLRYVWMFQAFAIMLWAAVMPHFYLSLMASVLVGLCTTTLWSYTYTLLQHHTDPAYYGRVVAYNDMLFLLMAAATSMLIGFCADAGVSLPMITLMLGVLFVVATWYYYWLQQRFELKEIP